jgi:hypothetical protein
MSAIDRENGFISLIDSDINLTDDRKLILGNSENTWLKYSNDFSGIVGQTDPSGTYSINSSGTLWIYPNCGPTGSGNYEPGLEFDASGTTVLRNCGSPQGSEADRHFAIFMDQGTDAGDHQQFWVGRGSDGITNDPSKTHLILGYRDGVSAALVQSTNTVPLVLGTAGTPSAITIADAGDVAIQENKKVIFGNSGDAWIQYNSDVVGFVFNSQSSGEDSLNSIKGLNIESHTNIDGSGPYEPSIYLRDGGEIEFQTGKLSDFTNNFVQLTTSYGAEEVDSGDHIQIKIGQHNQPSVHLTLGYQANGSAVTAAFIHGNGFPLVFGTTAVTTVAKITDTGIKLIDGSPSDPSYTFSSAPTDGFFYFSGSNPGFGYAAGGTHIYTFANDGIRFTAAGETYLEFDYDGAFDDTYQIYMGSSGGLEIRATNNSLGIDYYSGGAQRLMELDPSGIKLPDGTVTAPSFSFFNQPTGGILFDGDNSILQGPDTKGAALYSNATQGSGLIVSGGISDGNFELFGATCNIRNVEGGNPYIRFATSSAITMKVDSDSTAGNTRFFLWDVDSGALQRVTVGSANSGGSGFKLLRIPN